MKFTLEDVGHLYKNLNYDAEGKPNLKRLEELTYDEKLELFGYQSKVQIDNDLIDVETECRKLNPSAFLFLLNRNYDLFKLLPSIA